MKQEILRCVFTSVVFLIATGCVSTPNSQAQSGPQNPPTLRNPPFHDPPYPIHWWTPVNPVGAPSWEILPQAAGYGEVILSKRHELGLLSNFAPTPFTFRGKRYASVEGFWQGTKYPETNLTQSDPRSQVVWPHTRAEVEAMTAFDAKHAGDDANEVMKKLGIDWVTFEGVRMTYKQTGESPFYNLVLQVMKAKLDQNPEVKKVLLETGDLILKPDHHDTEGPDLLAWHYFDIWMKFRKELQTSSSL